MPEELDLEEHDALDERGPRASRSDRKSSRGYSDDDGGFGSHPHRNPSRRDDNKDQRRRVAQSREEPPFQAPRPPYNPTPGGFQRNRDATPPFASGGARVPERPRAPYPDRFDRGQGRPINSPSYGNNSSDNRGPGFRPVRPPMNSSPQPRPPAAGQDAPFPRGERPAPGREVQGIRDGRPSGPSYPRPDTRPAGVRPVAPQQGLPQQRPAGSGYTSNPARGSGPGAPSSAGRPASRRPDAPPYRPYPPRDDPRRIRRDDSEPAPERP